MSDEDRFLEEISLGRDEQARLVYADWLSERGRDDEAEFVRTEHQRYVAGRELGSARRRLDAVAGRLDAGWRRRIERREDTWTLVQLDEWRSESDNPSTLIYIRDADVWPSLRKAIRTGGDLFYLAIGMVRGESYARWKAELVRGGLDRAHIERAERLVRTDSYPRYFLTAPGVPPPKLDEKTARLSPPLLVSRCHEHLYSEEDDLHWR